MPGPASLLRVLEARYLPGHAARLRIGHVPDASGALAADDAHMKNSAVPTEAPEWGSHDGSGAGDHDMPYIFGRRPRASTPYPFSTRQYAHLLVLRSRIDAELFGRDDRTAA
jgi:hypothetical protein